MVGNDFQNTQAFVHWGPGNSRRAGRSLLRTNVRIYIYIRPSFYRLLYCRIVRFASDFLIDLFLLVSVVSCNSFYSEAYLWGSRQWEDFPGKLVGGSNRQSQLLKILTTIAGRYEDTAPILVVYRRINSGIMATQWLQINTCWLDSNSFLKFIFCDKHCCTYNTFLYINLFPRPKGNEKYNSCFLSFVVGAIDWIRVHNRLHSGIFVIKA